jgi:hypothetical protein
MLIHFVQLVILSVNVSAGNWDQTFKRRKGPLPGTSRTVWGQVHAATQDRQDPKRIGDGDRVDGYVYLEKPVPYAFKKGDQIQTVDGRAFAAEIVEVRDESAYHEGHALQRLDYRFTWDAPED